MSLSSGCDLLALAAQHAVEPERRAAAAHFGARCIPRLPVEAVEAEHQALFLRAPMHVGDLDLGILQMGRHDLEIIRVEGDEFQRLHDRLHMAAPDAILP